MTSYRDDQVHDSYSSYDKELFRQIVREVGGYT